MNQIKDCSSVMYRVATIGISVLVTTALIPIIVPVGLWIFIGHLADKCGQRRTARNLRKFPMSAQEGVEDEFNRYF